MADQRIAYTEEMVGSGHPTKADTLNRLALVDHGTDGQHTLSGFQGSQFAADAGANDTYVITLDPVPAAYFTGMMIVFTANTANTGAATINVNSLGAKAIKKQKDVALGDGDIKAGQTVVLVYDGTNFQLVNPPSALTITGGTNTFNLTNGTASLDVAAGKTVNIDDDVTVSAELHVEAATHVNQDLTSDASPTFAGVTLPAITAPAASLKIKPTTDATTAIQLANSSGTAVLNVDTTNGNVSIGTTSPDSLLNIVKSQNADTTLHISNVTNNSIAMAQLKLTNDVGDGMIKAISSGYTPVADWAKSLAIQADTPLDGGIILYSSDKVRIQNVVGTDAMTIKSGNVGIGTTNPTSTIHGAGSFALPITTKTADYTAGSSDYTILVSCSSANITITLPAVASYVGRIYNIKKIDATGYTVIIDGNSSETIDGALTQTISTQYETLTIQNNGSSWYII
jgi:hypothetical protein